MTAPHEDRATPSHWVRRHVHHIRSAGLVLDLACGGGRHTVYLLERGYGVVAVDRDTSRLADIVGRQDLEVVDADLEADPWPFAGRAFDGIVVTNYLHRPLFPLIINGLNIGGVLIYETFACGNELYGHPRNPDYLLTPGELFDAFHGPLDVIAYEHGKIDRPNPAVVQRITAVRTGPERVHWPIAN